MTFFTELLYESKIFIIEQNLVNKLKFFENGRSQYTDQISLTLFFRNLEIINPIKFEL